MNPGIVSTRTPSAFRRFDSYPFNFALPGRNGIMSHFPHAEHRVGEDVGLGIRDLISSVTQ